MPSQGSSSVRICSRTAFGPISSNPLSREVSTPSATSIKFAPEVTSRPVDKRDMESVRETMSTSGRFSEEEEEVEVVVSCEDLQSALAAEDSVRIARQYDLEVVAPYDQRGRTLLQTIT